MPATGSSQIASRLRHAGPGARCRMQDHAVATYLHDHLGGAAFAVELLESLHNAHPPEPSGLFAAAMLAEVEADRSVLQQLAQRCESGPHGLKQAAGWVAEKASRAKLHGRGPLGTFEALEALALGILGKEALWNALAVAALVDPRLQGVDYAALAVCAREQHGKVEAQRLEAARAAFTPAAATA